jgi:hypothetical protein
MTRGTWHDLLMITGAHLLLYSPDPEADRSFFRDAMRFLSVDAGHGWLIFGLPAAELAVLPSTPYPPVLWRFHTCP